MNIKTEKTMKKITYSLLALLILVGCQEDEWIGSKQQEIRVTASLPVTRTTFTEDGNVTHVYWEKDDNILICTEAQNSLWYIASETGREVEFNNLGERLKAADGDSVYASYPHSVQNGDNPFIVRLPNIYQQKYIDNYNYDFIYAADVVKNGQVNLQFKHLFAFLKIIISKDLMPDIGSSGGFHMASTEKLTFTSAYFDLKKEEIVFKSTVYDNMSYDVPDTVKSEEITCYIAILPQSSEATFSFYPISNGLVGTQECIIQKKVPEGGFKAGNIYTLNLNISDVEERKQREKEALIAFYKATNGDNWTKKDNWCSDKPINEWYGIDSDGYDLGIAFLSENNIKGDIGEAITALLPLSNLKSLILQKNQMTGSIPETLGELDLEYINLSYNQISGELPKCLSNMTKLYHFDVSFNQMSGEVSPFYLSCPEMKYLDLNHNSFNGPLPEPWNISTYDTYHVFYLHSNNFTGNVPKSYARLMSYNSAWCINGNNLNGNLPSEIVNHELFKVYWPEMLFQHTGYGFSRVNIPAHDNTVQCFDGSFINLGEEYANHKYTLIFTWEYWCGFSVPYIPEIEKLYNKYKDKGLNVIGMTLGRYTMDLLTPYLNQMPSVKNFWGTHEVDDAEETTNDPYTSMGNYFLFNFGLTPFFHLIDNDGNIIFMGSRGSTDGVYDNISIANDYSGDSNTVPQHHERRDDIFSYIDELFAGDRYTSTDYSHDGDVLTLQKASTGKGIDLVFMGEAFTDKDMEQGGKYEQKMQEAMEQYFAIEPYKTFRNRFNVYAVKVVSPNEEFAEGAVHRINESDDVCFDYAKKVPGINTDKWYISVVYNSLNAGRSYTNMYGDGTFVGYMFEGVTNTLNHEVGGHGFAKLLDEYVEDGYENETLPEDDKENMDYNWQNFGWGANVDWRNDPTTVRWAHFLNDPRYANEGLGLYEGANLYGHGCYRPTENSMMRIQFIDSGKAFNAPSREQIYKCIMRESEGESWTYDYEKFVEYDKINRNAATTRALQTEPSAAQKQAWKQRHRRPVFIKGTWRDAVKKQKKDNIIVPLR